VAVLVLAGAFFILFQFNVRRIISMTKRYRWSLFARIDSAAWNSGGHINIMVLGLVWLIALVSGDDAIIGYRKISFDDLREIAQLKPAPVNSDSSMKRQ